MKKCDLIAAGWTNEVIIKSPTAIDEFNNYKAVDLQFFESSEFIQLQLTNGLIAGKANWEYN